MLVGDRFLADKMTPFFRGPYRDEIVAFNHPLYKYSQNPIINWYQRYVDWSIVGWTKRVIGIPGDHIEGNPQGCIQNLFSFKFLEFFQWIWSFDRKHRPDVLHILQEFETTKQVYIIQSQQEMNDLINGFC